MRCSTHTRIGLATHPAEDLALGLLTGTVVDLPAQELPARLELEYLISISTPHRPRCHSRWRECQKGFPTFYACESCPPAASLVDVLLWLPPAPCIFEVSNGSRGPCHSRSGARHTRFVNTLASIKGPEISQWQRQEPRPDAISTRYLGGWRCLHTKHIFSHSCHEFQNSRAMLRTQPLDCANVLEGDGRVKVGNTRFG